ncbi:uncharacterized protein LOC135833358 [Planococcus citri]|uniref:uncharacterized protein LOC135833358 n=1 Tax=Planococcus citri TaxID=170843 RepID=UPI0031F8ABE3
MRVVALISGGKDSCYNLLQCVAAGHEIVALANLQPKSKDELDSFMYQTVGHQGVDLYAEAMGLPLFREETSGVAHHHHKWYTPTEGDEVEDLYNLLARVKNEIDFDGVSTGAVLSDYQRLRVENVCSRLGLVSLAYLWRRDQGELLQEMIDSGVEAVVIKVAALGLDPNKHLGMRLVEIQPHLIKMNQKYGLNICGEGGEYETFTLDCPFFRKRIVIDEFDTVIHSDDAFAPVGYLNFKKLLLVDKLDSGEPQNLSDLITSVKGPLEYVSDLELPDEQLVDNSNEGDTSKDVNDGSSCNSVVAQDRCDIKIFQNLSPKVHLNNSGWCWIGPLVGNSTDALVALQDILDKLKDLLQANQFSVRDLVSVTLFVSDMSQYSKVNSAYVNVIDINKAPVRVCVETQLPETSPILMEALAHKAINASPTQNERRTMHVQSISHWAPANIGPYSQAIKVGDIIYVAGQIALVPGIMQMVDGGIFQECRLALRHVGRIINAIDQNTLLRDVVQVICYVTEAEFIRPARKEWEKRSNNAIADYIVVPALPRNANIEWQVWAHRGNARFQYEETGCRIDKRHKAFLRRRFNYENTVSAVVCYLTRDNGASVEGDISVETEEAEPLQQFHIEQVLKYTLAKLMSGEPQPVDSVCSLRVFYPISQQLILNHVHDLLIKLTESIPMTYTMVPVIQLHSVNTVLSLCAVRHN